MQKPAAVTESTREYAPYNPARVEPKWYAYWLDKGYFKPETSPNFGRRAPFVITMPPPNVTGELHNGHALGMALEDLLIRWHRMLGDPALWVPGRDHAGIATQMVVERQLAKEGLTRQQLGREKFLERVWDWVNRYGTYIQQQIRRLGASADWDRDCFTLDPGPVHAVRTAFVRLYDEGLIYRGKRITNWCPRCQTALSDLEVVHKEVESQLYYVRYPLVPRQEGGEPEYLTVATTRPETILADTAVAVSPEDPRYRDLIGREARVPLIGRRVPLIGDEAVDPQFGTGALKVTPGHDPVDFEIGQRHGLPIVSVFTLDGYLNEEAGPFAGLTIAEARPAVVQALEREGLLVRTEPLRHAVGHCQRCGTRVEPLVTEQWYVRIKPLAEPAIEAVRDGRITIIPERFEKEYFHWMENIRDWCISRQLWWGHRIPVWYCRTCGEQMARVEDPTRCPNCGGADLEQDPDVLDTWFSSGLWPFSTLGWPKETEDLRRFYPTTVMETGHDILFFWVARMIMLGMHFTGDVPFRTVYLHGLLTQGGEKMSKTRGNVQDPITLIETFGTDALRLALVIGNSPGTNFEFNLEKLDSRRDFVNKLWNVGRFVLLNVRSEVRTRATEPLSLGEQNSLADRWIASRAAWVIDEVTRLLRDFQLGEAARTVYEFLWSEFADWYVEAAKIALRKATDDPARLPTEQMLVRVFEKLLRLLHPFAPFVTEELWQALTLPDGAEPTSSIMIQPWPEADTALRDLDAERAWHDLMAVVGEVRRMRADYHLDTRPLAATLVAGDAVPHWQSLALLLSGLPRMRLEPLTVVADEANAPARALVLVAGGVQVFIPVEGVVDLRRESERLAGEIGRTRSQVERLEAMLARPGFISQAPPHVVQAEREKLADFRDRLSKLEARREALDRLAARE